MIEKGSQQIKNDNELIHTIETARHLNDNVVFPAPILGLNRYKTMIILPAIIITAGSKELQINNIMGRNCLRLTWYIGEFFKLHPFCEQ